MPDISLIMAYEQGDLDYDETVDLFQDLLDSSMVWQLQGHYGRTATQLLEAGLITRSPKPHNDRRTQHVRSN